ncbi:MAG: rhodanese-like domain-containing protein [Pseudomonadota bacterium]
MTAVTELDAPTVKAWLDRGDTLLIDVREAAEHARECIPGARLVPLSTLDPANVKLDGAKRVVLHCASGLRSSRAAAMLRAAGHPEVAHLKGGLPAWKGAGYPTVVAAALAILRQEKMTFGGLVVLGAALGALAHPGFHALSAVVGAGLFASGAIGCGYMTSLLAKMPWNKHAA